MGRAASESPALVTGASRGIGLEVAKGLARSGREIILISRDGPAAATALQEVGRSATGTPPTLLAADLAIQQEVRRVASVIRSRWKGLALLIHNAAVISAARTVTVDGIELQFAVNHLAVYLLTHELADLLSATANSRVVVTASQVERSGAIDFDDLMRAQRYEPREVYAQSKLANVLFTRELARRWPSGPTVNCLHPGVVRTQLLNAHLNVNESRAAGGLVQRGKAALGGALRAVGLRAQGQDWALTPAEGARTTLFVATDPSLQGVTGQYFSDQRAIESSPQSREAPVAQRLWSESARLVAVSPEWPAPDSAATP